METHKLTSWSEFAEALRKLKRTHRTTESGPEPLFRGAGNNQWRLETTLERFCQSECRAQTLSFLEYYLRVWRSKPAIETFSGKRWDKILKPKELKELVISSYEYPEILFGNRTEIWEYLVYLRHHGFPSPLLDWTASPYVAAFFAFDQPPRGAKRVSVHAFIQDPNYAESNERLLTFGPYIQSDTRHLLQQSRYTMYLNIGSNREDYLFKPQREGLLNAASPGEGWYR